jgi:hypothetical protein
MKKIIKLTESDLTRIVNRVVEEHKFNIVKLSDTNDTGTWSADILTNKAQGKFMYIMKDGKYVKIDKVPNKRYNTSWGQRHTADYIEYMTPETAEEINSLLGRARELEAEAKELRRQAKEIAR